MKTMANLLLPLSLLNMVLLPVAQAQPAARFAQGRENVLRIERALQSRAAVERANAAMTADGTEILGLDNQPTTLASLLASGSDTFTVVTPADHRGNRFAVRVTRDLGTDQARMTYVLMDYTANPGLDARQALDRSTITLRSSDAPEAFQVAHQRMEARFNAAMARVTADNRGTLQKAVDAVIPSAHADRLEHQLYVVVSTLAICCVVVGPLMMIGGATALAALDNVTLGRFGIMGGGVVLGLAAALGSLIGVSALMTAFEE